MRYFILSLLMAGFVGIVGCSDGGADADREQARGYEGRTDDLLEKQASPTHQAELRRRLIMVQSDR